MNDIKIGEDAYIEFDRQVPVQRHEPMCKHAKIIGPHEGNPKYWSVEFVPRVLIASDSEGE